MIQSDSSPVDAPALYGYRSGCPIASTLDLVGDRWSLLVVRSLILGARTFAEIQRAPEGIASNILTSRLKALTSAGLVVRDGAGRRGRYRLTRAGAGLLPVLQAMASWGLAYLPDRWTPPQDFMAAQPDEVADVQRA